MNDRLKALPPAARTAFVFLAVAIALFASLSRQALVFDEGMILSGAMRVLQGQVVHRDFYSAYGPGSYWAIAALFGLFGPSFLTARLFGVVVAAACVTLSHRLIERNAGITIALGIAALITFWLIAIGCFLYPVYPCLALALAGALALTRRGGAASATSLLGAGAAAGTAALFRYDSGFFILAGFVLAVGITTFSTHRGAGRWLTILQRSSLIGLGAGLAFGVPALTCIVPLPAETFAGFRADIIEYPLKWYGPMRSLPWPTPMRLWQSPFDFGVYLPIVVLALAVPLIGEDLRRLRVQPAMPHPASVPTSLVLAILSAALFYKGTVRVSTLHMVMSIIPALALLGLLLRHWTATSLAGRRAALAASVALGYITYCGFEDVVRTFVLSPLDSIGIWSMRQAGLVSSPADDPAQCPSRRGMYPGLIAPEYQIISYYLARHSAPQDKVLVGLRKTDRVFVNAVMIYFAADRLPGTHWSVYDPGLQNRADVQGQMVRDLMRQNVKWIVRDASFDAYTEPNASSWHSGVTLLDDFVERNYREVGQAGAAGVWLRWDIPAPDASRDPIACQLRPIHAR